MENQKKNVGTIIGIIAVTVLLVASMVLFLVTMNNLSETIKSSTTLGSYKEEQSLNSIRKELDEIKDNLNDNSSIQVYEGKVKRVVVEYGDSSHTFNDFTLVIFKDKDYVQLKGSNGVLEYTIPWANISYIQYND